MIYARLRAILILEHITRTTKKENKKMAQNEITRLIEWLRNHGLTAEEILDCLEYVASGRSATQDE